jgi:Uncharacterised protein family (UPF0137)
MTKINDLLANRLKSPQEKMTKMREMAELSSRGALTGFSGVFQIQPLEETDSSKLKSILIQYRADDADTSQDYEQLAQLTCEVKAITSQAAILHGERIKKAQSILKNYQEGAFTAWLIATYGNRQTPYNFLYYYDLYVAMPKQLQSKLDSMPRQVVYTLAARQGELALKEAIIANFKHQSKLELLEEIKLTFPLKSTDKRNRKMSSSILAQIDRIQRSIEVLGMHVSKEEKKALVKRLKKLLETVGSLEC